jgi:hypothetical protein
MRTAGISTALRWHRHRHNVKLLGCCRAATSRNVLAHGDVIAIRRASSIRESTIYIGATGNGLVRAAVRSAREYDSGW